MPKCKAEFRITIEGDTASSSAGGARELAREMRALLVEGPLASKALDKVAIAVRTSGKKTKVAAKSRRRGTVPGLFGERQSAATRAKRSAAKRTKR